jgi:hypothetical protein
MFEEEGQGRCWKVEGAPNYCLGFKENEISRDDSILFCKNCLYYEHMQKNEKSSA